MDNQIAIEPEQLAPLVQMLGVWGTLALSGGFAVYKLVRRWLDQRNAARIKQAVATNGEDLEVVLEMIADDEESDLKLNARVASLAADVELLRARVDEAIALSERGDS